MVIWINQVLNFASPRNSRILENAFTTTSCATCSASATLFNIVAATENTAWWHGSTSAQKASLSPSHTSRTSHVSLFSTKHLPVIMTVTFRSNLLNRISLVP